MDLYAQLMLFYAKQHRLTPSAVQSKTKTKKTRSIPNSSSHGCDTPCRLLVLHKNICCLKDLISICIVFPLYSLPRINSSSPEKKKI